MFIIVSFITLLKWVHLLHKYIDLKDENIAVRFTKCFYGKMGLKKWYMYIYELFTNISLQQYISLKCMPYDKG